MGAADVEKGVYVSRGSVSMQINGVATKKKTQKNSTPKKHHIPTQSLFVPKKPHTINLMLSR